MLRAFATSRAAMELTGWGGHPRMQARIVAPATPAECALFVQQPGRVIARGMGRSYGDSALGPAVLSTLRLDHFLAFDAQAGVLTCTAGTTLDAIIRHFVPLGWFLAVTPGTRFVTVGGAIASDVHGKNHHAAGTFSAYVASMEILLGNGETAHASRERHADLFRATCGGMGLTGVILTAQVQLVRIASSEMLETTVKTPNLEALIEAFEAHAAGTYSVAWIDCLSRGAALGRSLLMVGEHAPHGSRVVHAAVPRPVPFDMPAWFLNRAAAQAFNLAYWGRVVRQRRIRRVSLLKYFYPLDALTETRRLYGRAGFVQYQLVIPKAAGPRALRGLIDRVACSGHGAFLAVLKVFGKANANPLSFPLEGYTLAMDFRAEPGVFEMLDGLDRMVLDHGGRTYLTKDARMSEATFKASYPLWAEFEEIRARWHAHGKFASAQSLRLGLA